MNNTQTRTEKIAKTTALVGVVIAIIMPFLSVPFHVPYPFWALTPMEHSIYFICVSLLVLSIGVPASILTIRLKRRQVGWLSLLGCVATFPLGIAADMFESVNSKLLVHPFLQGG